MTKRAIAAHDYDEFRSGIVEVLESARRAAARSVNAIMTASYWEIGRWIVETEQGGAHRTAYGETLIARLATDLTSRFVLGFGKANLANMRAFYQQWPPERIFQTASGKSALTASSEVHLAALAARFALP